ncbi:GNAT family N-acetyltransferase [Microbulbifer yueqingensis]|uniref:Acetyltransferase (GNAT) family protein n=1 Tax=Microbulbifer yueqingensis TaxID=658219 RepID=A0A1G9EGM9_9GAMM|nr:GNAT family N-acetyltransferase [Microbulbifer yueqingensis]SDK75310.1 Acetyltransferase (GNAT) family protein [Microbulbifer yueqingensis]
MAPGEVVELHEPGPQHLEVLMSWIADREQCLQWGGPVFRFPFSPATFREDCRWDELAGGVLVDGCGHMVAFGQYYRRLGRCHLGHLVVSPGRRGQGLGKRLVRALARRGCAELEAAECSLFVLKNNAAARALYRRLGFVPAEHPESFPWQDQCDFLVAPAGALDESPTNH